MRILILGLPGSGKTTLAIPLSKVLDCPHINADKIRTIYSDWDFSYAGRIRQAKRMTYLSHKEKISITDFVCPTEETRSQFNADFTIWMDTIDKSQYEDTNKIFEKPKQYDIRIREWIDVNQLFSSSAAGNLGIEDIPNYLKRLFNKLDK